MRQAELYQLYQKYCAYQINDTVQLLDFDIDIELLRREIFNFIIKNKFGYNAVSLRLPLGYNNYIDNTESLVATASSAFTRQSAYTNARNPIPDSNYTVWHPNIKDSYLTSLVPLLEQFCNFQIGRIRLGWLQPGCGYPLHIDLEPLRLHIPIFTNNFAYILHDDTTTNMKYGKLYHLLTANIHTAWNFGKLPRLHLIFSTYGDEDLTNSLNKLDNILVTSNNYDNHIKGQGVDDYSLSQLNLISDKLE